MRYLFLFMLTGPLFAVSLDEQIIAAQQEEKAASRKSHQLGSQKAAARIDSIFQADSTLTAEKVRVVAGDKDSMWVKIALDKLTHLDRKIVRAELKGAELSWQETSSLDTLYMRRDRAERARGIISAALHGE